VREAPFGNGALHEHHHGRPYNADAAFVAAALHDLGLLAPYESEGKSFEVDSANAAERVALENGLAPDVAKLVWNATAMHDMRWAVVEKQNPGAAFPDPTASIRSAPFAE
jgi:hypothetical protein